MLTEQLLRRSPDLAALNPVASAHHEKAVGSGYHKRLRAGTIYRGAGLLAAADIYVDLTTERADRPASSDGHAATELNRLASDGVLDHDMVGAVLSAAGHDAPAKPPRSPTRGGSPVARSTCCGWQHWASRRGRSPNVSSSPRRPPTTTSSTSTRRSGSRPELCSLVGDAERRHPLSELGA